MHEETSTTSPKAQRPSLAGACDCHFHAYSSDPGHFPAASAHDPAHDTATLAAYRSVREKLGLQRSVLVYPTAYRDDYRFLIETLRSDSSLRGITAVAPAITDQTLATLHEAGVRGIRFTTSRGHSIADLASLEALSERIAPMGWHVELYVPDRGMSELAPRLAKLRLPMVLDHFAGIQAAQGLQSADATAVLKLLDNGNVWIKLSAAYRLSSLAPHYDDLVLLARAFIARAPQRMVWGSDWPHGNIAGPAPDAKTLLEVLNVWAPDGATRRMILVDNPARLYDF